MMMSRRAVIGVGALLSGFLAAAPQGMGGAEVIASGRGLQVTLSAERATWAIGAVMEFEATLTNVSDRTVLADVFGDLNEVYQGKRSESITSCWSLVWPPARDLAALQRGRMPLDAGQLVQLLPGAAYTKRLSFQLPVVAHGRYQLELAYTPRSVNPSFQFPGGWITQHGLADQPVWEGMLFSNPVTIEVMEAS